MKFLEWLPICYEMSHIGTGFGLHQVAVTASIEEQNTKKNARTGVRA